MMIKKRERTEAVIPTSSMADIAFLLLIFFLVTTTIDVDTGIVMQLPPPLDEEEPPPIKERNMLKVLVNDEGQILVEDEPQNLAAVRRTVITHVTNNGNDPRYAETPGKAIVSLKTTRATSYLDYINVLDEMQMAYREIRDQEARRLGFSSYENYLTRRDPAQEDVIREKYKIKISLAEPDPGQ